MWLGQCKNTAGMAEPVLEGGKGAFPKLWNPRPQTHRAELAIPSPCSFPFFLWSNKGDVDGETFKIPLRSPRWEMIGMEILNMSDAVHAWLRINSTVTKETQGPEAIFNAHTGAHHDSLYEALKYLLSSAYVPRTKLRSSRFYRRKRRHELSRTGFLFCQ